jgi:Rad3-related DNA helicase
MEDPKATFVNFRDKPYRPGQEEAIRRILESDKKVVVVCACTGSGKGLIGMSAGAAHKKTCYICSSKQLQGQQTGDFPEAMSMMGRGNFRCNQDQENRTADMCIHTRATPCDLKSKCHYEVHKNRVVEHPLQILNYHYFLTEANYVGRFTDYPLVIGDEADVLEGLLTGFIELRVSRTRLDSLSLAPPQYRTATARFGLSSWRQWAEQEGKSKIEARMEKLATHMSRLRPNQQLTDRDQQAVREYKSLESLLSKLAMFTENMDETWIFQEQKNGRGGGGVGVSAHVAVTGTIPSVPFPSRGEVRTHVRHLPPKAVLAEMLGLSTGDIDYLEIPSTFPAENRPVLLDPVADMGFKTYQEELPNLIEGSGGFWISIPMRRG